MFRVQQETTRKTHYSKTSVIVCPHKPVDSVVTIEEQQNGFCVLLELR